MIKQNDKDETKTSDNSKLRVQGNKNKVYQNIKDSTINDEPVTSSHSSSKDNTAGNKIKRSEAIMWIASVSIIAAIGWFVVQPLEWIKNKLTQDNKIAIIQIHSGSGDIIGRDQVIHKHLYGSIDYQQLIEDIAYNKNILTSIPENDVEGRLRVSEKISQLEGQLESFKEYVFRLYETFTKIPINTERLKQAKALFDEGKFREADAILKAEEMNIELEVADRLQKEGENKIEEANQIKDKIANEFLIKAQLWSTFYNEPDWNEKANQHYEQALNASRNGNILFEYAHFLHSNKQYNKALPLYEETLKIYMELEESSNIKQSPDVARILNNLGLIYFERSNIALAKLNYDKSLNMYHKLSESDSLTYLPYVAIVLTNLANLHSKKREFDQAQDKYEEALKIYRKLAETSLDAYLPHVANILNNYALNLKSMDNLVEAEDKYKEALRIRKSIAVNNPTIYLPQVAKTLHDWAVLQEQNNKYNEAREKYNESLNIYSTLADVNPIKYLPSIAMLLNNYGLLHRREDNIDEAIKIYTNAIYIYRYLVKYNPEAYSEEFVFISLNIANLLLRKEEYVKAQKSYEEAIEILKELADSSPDYSPFLVRALRNFGVLLVGKNEFAEAQDKYEKAIEILLELVESNPEMYQRDYADTHYNLALLHSKQDRFDEAQESYEVVLEIYRMLDESHPSKYSDRLADTLNNYGTMLKKKKEYAIALKKYEEALAIRRELAESNPTRYLPDVAMTLCNLSDNYFNEGSNKNKSIEYAKECVKIAITFDNIPVVQLYFKDAIDILQANGVDVEEFLDNLRKSFSNPTDTAKPQGEEQ